MATPGFGSYTPATSAHLQHISSRTIVRCGVVSAGTRPNRRRWRPNRQHRSIILTADISPTNPSDISPTPHSPLLPRQESRWQYARDLYTVLTTEPAVAADWWQYARDLYTVLTTEPAVAADWRRQRRHSSLSRQLVSKLR